MEEEEEEEEEEETDPCPRLSCLDEHLAEKLVLVHNGSLKKQTKEEQEQCEHSYHSTPLTTQTPTSSTGHN